MNDADVIKLMDWTQLIIFIASLLGGMVIHYIKAESKQEERAKHLDKKLEDLKEWLRTHENKISNIEGSHIQPTGQSTYMPRPECDRRYEEIEKRMKDFMCEAKRKAEIYQKCISALENRVVALEIKAGFSRRTGGYKSES